MSENDEAVTGETAPRPAPQYGEYATPEQQRAAIRQPDATLALESGEKPVAPTRGSARGAAAAHGGSVANGARTGFGAGVGAGVGAADPTGISVGRLIDRFATIAMLVYGALSVATSIVAYLDLPGYLTRAYALLGVPGTFTNVESARVWGPVAAVAVAVGFAVTAWVAVRWLRRRRITFWVPLLGGLITTAVVSVALLAPIFGDPAFIAYAQGG
ncbi:DUF6264 family protein [uncultured Microbacterium sp.]|uniref:DUF6264 family protein n=1 Tax=uncultured Microbacterium sp. TaxID=191216 RepID=UPI0025D02979|nr:DUF6264 family protein [uncultured Microbacterium sp.]